MLTIQVRSKRVFPKVRTQKGVAIADYMRTLGHCQDTGENLEILEGGRKTSRERANSRRDENDSQFRHQTSLFPMIRCRICWKHTLSHPINRIYPLNLINSQFLLMLMNFLQWRKTWKIWRVDANHLGSGPSNSISLDFDAESVGSICWVIQVIAYIHWIW